MGKTKIKPVEETTAEVKPEETPVAPQPEKEAKKAAPLPAGRQVKASKKTKKAGQPKHRSSKYREAIAEVEKSKHYHLTEAVTLAQKSSYSKFDGTLEAHINTTTENIRGLVLMPYVTGKALKVLAFGEKAQESGADVVGTEETIEEINKGKIDFDIVVATPAWMPKLAKVARILGPRSLMPNPKSGTVSDDLTKAVADLKGGRTEFKTEAKGKIIHITIGKVKQPVEEVSANIKALYNSVGRGRIKKITLSPTMGAGVKVDLGTI